MSSVFLIHAGPTQWDVEDRVVGNHPLPLMELARETIESVVANIAVPVTAIYRHKKNEACDQVAKMVAAKFKLRPGDSSALDEWNLGLWQGLTHSDLKFRYPKVAEQWRENPSAVTPPEGESIGEAFERLRGGLKRIVRRNRSGTIAICLRPLALQIMLGILRGEQPAGIAKHLHNITPIETIELPDGGQL